MATTAPHPELAVSPDEAPRLDAFVERARPRRRRVPRASTRRPSTGSSGRWSSPGLEHAVELAELAMEETGFGVFEDKVVKNYIATEFLYDYLKDKQLGRRHRRGPRARHPVRRRADRRRAGAAADHQPDLDRAVQGDRRRQDAQRDDLPPLGARGALRARARSSCSRRPARRPGCRPDALQVVPDPTLDVSQYLFHHPGVDFIWTTGGPEGGRRDQRGRQAVHQRRARATRRSTCTAAPTSRWPSSTS